MIDHVYNRVFVPHLMSEKLPSDLLLGTSLAPVEYNINTHLTYNDCSPEVRMPHLDTATYRCDSQDQHTHWHCIVYQLVINIIVDC